MSTLQDHIISIHNYVGIENEIKKLYRTREDILKTINYFEKRRDCKSVQNLKKDILEINKQLMNAIKNSYKLEQNLKQSVKMFSAYVASMESDFKKLDAIILDKEEQIISSKKALTAIQQGVEKTYSDIIQNREELEKVQKEKKDLEALIISKQQKSQNDFGSNSLISKINPTLEPNKTHALHSDEVAIFISEQNLDQTHVVIILDNTLFTPYYELVLHNIYVPNIEKKSIHEIFTSCKFFYLSSIAFQASVHIITKENPKAICKEIDNSLENINIMTLTPNEKLDNLLSYIVNENNFRHYYFIVKTEMEEKLVKQMIEQKKQNNTNIIYYIFRTSIIDEMIQLHKNR